MCPFTGYVCSVREQCVESRVAVKSPQVWVVAESQGFPRQQAMVNSLAEERKRFVPLALLEFYDGQIVSGFCSLRAVRTDEAMFDIEQGKRHFFGFIERAHAGFHCRFVHHVVNCREVFHSMDAALNVQSLPL